ncbi:hypothetical protein MSG28_012434 [Choristoneura fumiferana]|uniref:Uncharacterized protein n=1 Tax=Choristoneura fumiferana TaxID=7141 RepID=A0ACC0KDK3_CHOFU|nr:hypothetical protein MSG28_012434 [Choristoneura fumiferana]
MEQWPVKMKHTFYLVVFALCSVEFGLVSAALPPWSADGQQALKRVARQIPPPPPPPSPPQPQDIPGYPGLADMFEDAGAAMGASRDRREAKGGGAMPTRKG